MSDEQEQRKDSYTFASTETEEFQIVKDFVLYLMGSWGMAVDPEATEEMAAKVEAVMEATKDLLEQSGILRGPGRYGPPYAKDMDQAQKLLSGSAIGSGE